jgi:AraC family transcriptional regulator
MSNTQAEKYARRFAKVLDHIESNLGETLSTELLSQVANFSKFHFHRQFAEYVSTSVGRYIQLLRLRQASYRLAFSRQDKIIDIALDAGFENPESFTRAFRNTFGQSPSAFRRQPDWESGMTAIASVSRKRKQTVQVEIVDFKTTRVAVMEHRGPTERVNDSVGQFIDWRQASGLSPKNSSRSFGIVPTTRTPANLQTSGSISAEKCMTRCRPTRRA